MADFARPNRNTTSFKCLSEQPKEKPSLLAVRTLYKTCKITHFAVHLQPMAGIQGGKKIYTLSCPPHQRHVSSYSRGEKGKVTHFSGLVVQVFKICNETIVTNK